MFRGRRQLLCIVICTSSGVPAAEWALDGRLQSTMTWNENLQLRTGDVEPVGGAVVEVAPRLAWATPRQDLQLTPRYVLRRYDDDGALDSNDRYVDALWRGRGRGERSVLSLSAAYADDSTLTSEVDDSGIIDSNQRRIGWSGGASGEYSLTSRLMLSASASVQANDYEDTGDQRLNDYRYESAVLGFARAVTPRTTLGMQVSAGRLTLDDFDFQSDDSSVRVTGSHSWSETLRMDLELGRDRTSSPAADSQGRVYLARLERSGERFDWRVLASQDVAPSGRGVLVRRTEVGAGGSWRLAPFWTAGLAVKWLQNEDQSAPGLPDDDRSYSRAEASVEWRPRADWRLTMRGGYASQQFDGDADSASGSFASFGVAWSVPRLAVSR